MNALTLPNAPILVSDLIAATASTVPDLRGTMTVPLSEGRSPLSVRVSNREQAKQVHLVDLCKMARAGTITPRSLLTSSPVHDDDYKVILNCVLTFADAQAFCDYLAIDLQPATPVPQESTEERDAKVLAAFRRLGGEVKRGKLGGRRGALAALEAEDGRVRQTLTPIILRAAEREPQSGGHFSGLTR